MIKFWRFVIKWDQKGWFRALGLHHACVTMIVIFIGHHLGVGRDAGAIMVGWYLQREWGPNIKPRTPFEILDFVLPLIAWLTYLYFI